jgi:hypothetical protein
MSTSGRVALSLVLAFSLYAAEKRDRKEGLLVHKDVIGSPASPRYEYIVSDLTIRYTIQYDTPVKALPRQRVKFVIEKDRFILLDTDGTERPSHIEKRERVIYDPGRLFR